MAYYINENGQAVPGSKPEKKIDPILGMSMEDYKKEQAAKERIKKASAKNKKPLKLTKKSSNGLGGNKIVDRGQQMIDEAYANADYNHPKSYNTLEKIWNRL